MIPPESPMCFSSWLFTGRRCPVSLSVKCQEQPLAPTPTPASVHTQKWKCYLFLPGSFSPFLSGGEAGPGRCHKKPSGRKIGGWPRGPGRQVARRQLLLWSSCHFWLNMCVCVYFLTVRAVQQRHPRPRGEASAPNAGGLQVTFRQPPGRSALFSTPP